MANSDLLLTCSPSPSKVLSNHVSKMMIATMIGMINPPAVVSPHDNNEYDSITFGTITNNNNSNNEYYLDTNDNLFHSLNPSNNETMCKDDDDKDDHSIDDDDSIECNFNSPKKDGRFGNYLGDSISHFPKPPRHYDNNDDNNNDHDEEVDDENDNDDDNDSIEELNDDQLQLLHSSFLSGSFLGDSTSDFDCVRSYNSSRESLFSFDLEDDGYDDVDNEKDNDDEDSLYNDDDEENDAFDTNHHNVMMLSMNASFGFIGQESVSRISYDEISMVSSNDGNRSVATNLKSVRFSHATVREYSVTVGCHSATSNDLCPIQLSWEYAVGKEKVIDLRCQHNRRRLYNNNSSDTDDSSVSMTSTSPRLARRYRKKDQQRDAANEILKSNNKLPSRLSLEERRQYIARIRGISIYDVLELEKEVAITIQEQQQQVMTDSIPL